MEITEQIIKIGGTAITVILAWILGRNRYKSIQQELDTVIKIAEHEKEFYSDHKKKSGLLYEKFRDIKIKTLGFRCESKVLEKLEKELKKSRSKHIPNPAKYSLQRASRFLKLDEKNNLVIYLPWDDRFNFIAFHLISFVLIIGSVLVEVKIDQPTTKVLLLQASFLIIGISFIFFNFNYYSFFTVRSWLKSLRKKSS